MSDGPSMSSRGLLFGSVAELYERYRPGYPAELVDAVTRYARRPVRSALEVGAGTGKATRVFAATGIEVTALEPDPEMAAVLAETTRELPVRPVVATLESWSTDDRFDLLYSAAAWHWVDPAVRRQRAVDLLAPGGVLALFGMPCDYADPDVRAAVEDVERGILIAGDAGHPWTAADLAATDGLVGVVETHLPSVDTIGAERIVGLLSTVSAYLALPPDVRADALARVRAVLPDRVAVDTTVHLCVARRA